jgi:hypothetical protein
MKPGPCGARLWIEAAAEVPVIRKMFLGVYSEALSTMISSSTEIITVFGLLISHY